MACDLLVTSVGVAPLGQLACNVGARFVYDDAVASFRVEGQPKGAWLAGSVAHRHDLAAVLADGAAAGTAAAGGAGGAIAFAAVTSLGWASQAVVQLGQGYSYMAILRALEDGVADLPLAEGSQHRPQIRPIGPLDARPEMGKALSRRESPVFGVARPPTTRSSPPR